MGLKKGVLGITGIDTSINCWGICRGVEVLDCQMALQILQLWGQRMLLLAPPTVHTLTTLQSGLPGSWRGHKSDPSEGLCARILVISYRYQSFFGGSACENIVIS